MKEKRVVYFVSESTAITAETLGNSLLSQFPGVEFERHYIPFINSVTKAKALVRELNDAASRFDHKPLVFATTTGEEINRMLEEAACHYYELFERYLEQIGNDLGIQPARESGLSHGVINTQTYDLRIDTVNYTLSHDDAMTMKNLNLSDVILIGVSRSGKTPTSLYLALHYGVKAANYPLTEEDFSVNDLPPELIANRHKLVAITIDAQRLREVRERRRPGSKYATLATCTSEIRKAQLIFKQYGLTALDTTMSSIEELAARIVRIRGLKPKN